MKEIETKLGIRFPAAMKHFFAKPKECEYLRVPTIEQLCALEEVWPSLPPRVFVVFGVLSGDALGIYYPRAGGTPFLVDYHKDDNWIQPITSDLDFVFLDPDRYSIDNPMNARRKLRPADDAAWHHLLIDPKAAVPELELLKPMSLNFPAFDRRDELFRFGSDRGATLIREYFRKSQDRFKHKPWIELSQAFVQRGQYNHALQCLENCWMALHRFPTQGTAKDIVAVFERMLTIARDHGDAFDRVMTERQLQVAQKQG